MKKTEGFCKSSLCVSGKNKNKAMLYLVRKIEKKNPTETTILVDMKELVALLVFGIKLVSSSQFECLMTSTF